MCITILLADSNVCKVATLIAFFLLLEFAIRIYIANFTVGYTKMCLSFPIQCYCLHVGNLFWRTYKLWNNEMKTLSLQYEQYVIDVGHQAKII